MEPLIAKSERIYLKILNTGLVRDTCCFYKVYFLVQNVLETYLIEEKMQSEPQVLFLTCQIFSP